ncbi:hypothetical protein ACCD10_01620 [Pseudomonas sp. Pseusp122]|uniref:hypothetical protein n=1 Tax=unclassified Pseudomonas TaxID=196821 RepID=UPI0039A5867B
MTPPQALDYRLYGTLQPRPEEQLTHVGALDFLAQGAQLRRLRADGREILRGVGLVIRDGFWGTHTLLECHRETRVQAHHWWRKVQGVVTSSGEESALQWQVEMDVRDEKLSIRAQLRARRDFSTCRAGLMLLHPLQGVVGAPVTVIHGDGQSETGAFPDLISPSQPFFDIQGLVHSPTPGLTLDWRMSGDVFEMEDQRNWSDASFKTYNRPLAWPCPYVIEAGECIEQCIELHVLRQQEGRP